MKTEGNRPLCRVICIGGPWDGKELEFSPMPLGFWDRRMGTAPCHYQVIGNLALWMRNDAE